MFPSVDQTGSWKQPNNLYFFSLNSFSFLSFRRMWDRLNWYKSLKKENHRQSRDTLSSPSTYIQFQSELHSSKEFLKHNYRLLHQKRSFFFRKSDGAQKICQITILHLKFWNKSPLTQRRRICEVAKNTGKFKQKV